MRKILPRKFFNQPTLKAAEGLLGKFLVRRLPSSLGGKEIALMITEVEAYDGPKDKASHAHYGKTERNKIMFGPAGHWYVYFTYGMHWMLNIVVGPKNYPAAVLIRGALACESAIIYDSSARKIISGPGRLTKFLKIDKKFNDTPANKKIGLWIEDRGVKIKKSQIKRSGRIGVHYAGKAWANKPYRFHCEF